MKKIIIILFLISTSTFSQITTNFIRDGFLVDKPEMISNTVIKFKKNSQLEILDFINDKWWKVKYKNKIGFVTSLYINITDKVLVFKEKRNSTLKALLTKEKIKKENGLKKIDSMKSNIIKIARDTLLIENIGKSINIRENPSIFSKIIYKTKGNTKCAFLDYFENYYMVKVDSVVGYLSESQINLDYSFNKELVQELKKAKKRNLIKKQIDERLKLQEKEKNEYFEKCSYYKNEIDEFTNKTRKQTIFYNIDSYKNAFSKIKISLRRYGTERIIEFRTQLDLGCTSPYKNNQSYVKVKLENGDIMTFYHRGDIDCGIFYLVGYITNNDILRLKKSPIKSIRLSGTDFYEDIKDIYFKDFFKKKLDCIN